MTEDQKVIKQSLANFVGALIESSKYNDQDARHEAVALILEEALRLSQNDDGSYNLFVLKPFYRAMIRVLEDRKTQLGDLPEEVKAKTTQEIDSMIKSLKKVTG